MGCAAGVILRSEGTKNLAVQNQSEILRFAQDDTHGR
jgi:hypothetical protein